MDFCYFFFISVAALVLGAPLTYWCLQPASASARVIGGVGGETENRFFRSCVPFIMLLCCCGVSFSQPVTDKYTSSD
jgi:hypothetical protein